MSDLSQKTRKHLDEIIKMSHKNFGEESLHLLGKNSNYQIEAIPTGSISLDIALGIGGIPRGRIIEIYGDFSSGKSTICQHIIAQAQILGGIAVFIDTEHALDPVYAKACGINIDDLLVSQPNTGEQALEMVDKMLDYKPAIIVIDSVAGLVPKAMIEGEMGDSHMALQARLMSQALAKLTGRAKKANTTIIFTNQIRQKIGVFFGPNTVTPGGMALRFWASVRLECTPRAIEKGKTEEDKNGVARQHVISVKKNKVAPPFKKAQVTIRFGEGLSLIDELIDYIDSSKLLNAFVEKAGAWYTIKTDHPEKISGRINFREFLLENNNILIEIESALRNKLRLPLRIETKLNV